MSASFASSAARSFAARSFAAKATAVTLLLGGAAAVIVHLAAGPAAVPAAAWAAGLVLAGSLLGHLAGRLVPAGRPEAAAQAALVALGVRLLGTAALCFVAIEAGVAPRTPFALVAGALYLALLALEVGQAVAEVRAASPVPAAPPPSSGASE